MSASVAWRMPEGELADQRAENRCEPNEPVSIEELRSLGVLHWRLNPATMLCPGPNGEKSPIDRICDDMGYKNRDQVTCSPEKLPNYDAKLKTFFEEHIHEDDEIRLILDGVGFFDVRDKNDRWVRIRMVPGDLIVLPAGIYHRFTMDASDYTQALRLFKEAPVWTPINRPCDDNPVRKQYVDAFIVNPAPPTTVLGVANGVDNVYISDPTAFDTVVRGTVRSLNGLKHEVVVLYFTGVHNPVTDRSWCPDCVSADEIVKASVLKGREKGLKVRLVTMAIERSSYLGNSEYLLRNHPFVELKSIPTVIVAISTKTTDSDDAEVGIDVVYRSENPDDSWVDKMEAV